MAKAICKKTKKEQALQLIKDLLDVSDIADSVEFTVKIDRESIPTISYKINGFPLIPPYINTEDDI